MAQKNNSSQVAKMRNHIALQLSFWTLSFAINLAAHGADFHKMDWGAAQTRAFQGDVVLDRTQRETVANFIMSSDVAKSKTSVILTTIYLSTLNEKPGNLRSNTKDLVEILIRLSLLEDLDDVSAEAAFLTLSLNFDDTPQGVKLEEKSWSELFPKLSTERKTQFVESLGLACWSEVSEKRWGKLLEIFEDGKSGETLRITIIKTLSNSVFPINSSYIKDNKPLGKMLKTLNVFEEFRQSQHLTERINQAMTQSIYDWQHSHRTNLLLNRAGLSLQDLVN